MTQDIKHNRKLLNARKMKVDGVESFMSWWRLARSIGGRSSMSE